MQTLLLATMETLINHTIQLDPEYQKTLTKLHGKVIKLSISQPQMNVFFIVGLQGFLLQSNHTENIDCELKASLLSYLFYPLMTSQDQQQALFDNSIEITGDLQSARQFQHFFQTLEIDWEEYLAKASNDVIAHQATALLASYFHHKHYMHQRMQENMADYLQFETRDIVEKRELATFNNRVDELRDDLSRLEARIQQIISSEKLK